MKPRARARDPRYYGVAEGIVVDVNDPAHEGRVKVTFPWFHDEDISEWCRVRQLYAGPGYGTFFVQEVGDEVLVAFVHGDMRLPIILGGLYNGKDKPPTHRASDLDQKMIRTKGGHEILLDDTGGQKRVRVRTAGGHEVDLDDDGSRVRVASSGGRTVELDDRALSVTVSNGVGQTVTLDPVGIRIEGGVIQITGAVVTIEGGIVNVSGSELNLGGAAGQHVVLGESMQALFNAHVHLLGGATTGTPVEPMTGAQISQVTKAV